MLFRFLVGLNCALRCDTSLWNVRFPWLMPLLSPEYVASETVRALKQGEEVLFFPKWMYPGYLFSR